MTRCIATVAFTALLVGAVFADEPKRYALVIGNGDYSIGKLRNPANDAKLISERLRELDFEVEQHVNLTRREMEESVVAFHRRIGNDGLALFYFAGHGIEIDGENYLIPTDGRLKDAFAVKHETLSQTYVLDAMSSSRSKVNVIVLDCCRNNPFERSLFRDIGRSRGLTQNGATPEGTMIVYATGSGETALDGTGDNSPFSEELATRLVSHPPQGLILRDVLYDAAASVKQKTGQISWVKMETSLGRVFLRPPHSETIRPPVFVQVPPPPQPPPEIPMPVPVPTETDKLQVFEEAKAEFRAQRYGPAIAGFTSVIDDVTLREHHALARRWRGQAYFRRGSLPTGLRNDLARAVDDYMSVGLPGLPLKIVASEAEIRDGNRPIVPVQRGQEVTVSKVRGTTLWVAQVDGNPRLTGWINRRAFLVDGAEEPEYIYESTQEAPTTSLPPDSDLRYRFEERLDRFAPQENGDYVAP